MTRSDFFTSQIYRYYKYSDIRKSTFTVGWGSTQWEREILLPSFVTFVLQIKKGSGKLNDQVIITITMQRNQAIYILGKQVQKSWNSSPSSYNISKAKERKMVVDISRLQKCGDNLFTEYKIYLLSYLFQDRSLRTKR